MADENRLLTLPSAAQVLGLSDYAIREAVRRGELMAARPNPNGRALVEPKELSRWARSVGLQAPDPRGGMHQTELVVERDSELAEAWASGRQELARDLMGSLERGCDRVESKVSRQIRQVLDRLLD